MESLTGQEKSRGPAAGLRPGLPTTFQFFLTHQHQNRRHYEAQYSVYALLCLSRLHEPAVTTTPLKTRREDSTTRQAKYRTSILMLFSTETWTAFPLLLAYSHLETQIDPIVRSQQMGTRMSHLGTDESLRIKCGKKSWKVHRRILNSMAC